MILSFLQINFNRCKLAHDLVDKYTSDHNIDIVLMSEPNKNITHNRHYLHDTNTDAAICLLGNRVKISKFIQATSYVGIITEDNLLIISAYISPNIADDQFEEIVTNLCSTFNPSRLQQSTMDNRG